MRWLLLILNVHLCCCFVLHIHPIEIIAYERPRKTTTPPYDQNTDIEMVKKKIKVEPLAGNVSSYADYFLVNKKYGSNLFFWFFPSEINPESAPVVVWLQGQPNASSLYGLFDENGPYGINRGEIELRNTSWTREHNVLYLDYCTSCGFSYAEDQRGYSLQLEDVGKNIIQALYQFYVLFPTLLKNELYLAGESMCGKYMFVVAHGILSNNRFFNVKLNLSGILIGNGFMEATQIVDHNDYILQLGLIDVQQYDRMSRHQGYWYSLVTSQNYQQAIDHWYKHCYSEVELAGYFSMYDARDANAFWNSEVPEFMNEERIRNHLRVGDRVFNVPEKHAYYIKEVFRSIPKVIAEVLDNLKVLFYSGQFDMLVPYVHTAYFLDQMEWEGVKSYYTADYNQWKVNNDTTLIGYSKTWQNLTHVMIRDAGHMVGCTQSAHLLSMLKKFINNEFRGNMDEREIHMMREYILEIEHWQD